MGSKDSYGLIMHNFNLRSKDSVRSGCSDSPTHEKEHATIPSGDVKLTSSGSAQK